ncbi:MAG: Thioredoxin-like [Pseudomonadota bacterium]
MLRFSKALSFAVSALVLALPAAPAQAQWTEPPAGYTYQQLASCPEKYKRYLACDDQMAIFNAAAKRAQANNRKLLVVFGGDWCPWCKIIDPELQKAEYLKHPDLDGKFEVVWIAYNVIKNSRKVSVPSGVAVENLLRPHMQVDQPTGFVPFFVVVEPKLPKPVVGIGNGRIADVVENKAVYIPTDFRRIMLEVTGQLDQIAAKSKVN